MLLMFLVLQILGRNGQRYTFMDIYRGALDCISFLKKYDIQKNDVIVMALPNMPEYFMLFIAIAACNAIVNICQPYYTASNQFP